MAMLLSEEEQIRRALGIPTKTEFFDPRMLYFDALGVVPALQGLFRIKGMKGRRAAKLIEELPVRSKGTFFDLFAGSGKVSRAAGLSKKFGRVRLGDLNERTANIHRMVQRHPEKIKELVRDFMHEIGIEKGLSYDEVPRLADFQERVMAGEFVREPTKQAAADIVLGSYGMHYDPGYRTRIKPSSGKHIRPHRLLERIEQHGEALRGGEVVHGSWEETVRGATKGDVIYADPPYMNTPGYRAGGFREKQTRELSRVLRKAYERGADVVVSEFEGVQKLFPWIEDWRPIGKGGKEIEGWATHRGR